MSKGILFLVLPQSDVAKVEALVREQIVPDQRDAVQILSDRKVAAFPSDVRSRTTADLIAHISTYPSHPENQLFVGHEARCSHGELSDWWTDEFEGAAPQKLKPQALHREIKRHLEKSGRHWRVRASGEVEKFDGLRDNLETWLQQFAKLDCTPIGRKIAARLRVIRTADLPHEAFARLPADLVGQRKANCYVQDDDIGGSWLEMQALLSHACPPGTVHPVSWDKASGRMKFPDVSVDEFVIYEDGLWSGSEAVRRLRAIAQDRPSAPVILRFGVVTDFGLRVVRQAIRFLELSSCVTVDTSKAELISFVREGLPEALDLGLGMDPDAYFVALHDYVAPYAFNPDDGWSEEEVRICETLGAQLVRVWRSRENKTPSTEAEQRFALGGGGFASTVLFSRSVPKVCLPLLWLDGTVELGDYRLNWRPLFVDSRRMSDGGVMVAAVAGASLRR